MSETGDLHGVLVVDKPAGPTSHDVVGRVRRALNTSRVGHAGTLDPLATGVLVVLVGEATKLAPYLTAHDKRYRTRVLLGSATDTFDAAGTETSAAPVPGSLRAEIALLAGDPEAPAPAIAAALEIEQRRTEQVPPAFSAVKVAGRRSYDRARAGEDVELAPRSVAVESLVVTGAGCAASSGDGHCYLDLELSVSKGYYVRSLARDLGASLGVPAHLASLRRTASGPFAEVEAVSLDATADTLVAALKPLESAAARSLPIYSLTEDGTRRARNGLPLRHEDFDSPPDRFPCALLGPDGRLVAIGVSDAEGVKVARGFVPVGR